jgi:predicted nuclease of restriction endonuclease-like RecB superfamily
LETTRRRKGQYVTDEQTWFEERFAETDSAWAMSRSAEILQTGSGEVVVPDLVFEHADGRRRFLEIIGYWRAGSLEARLAQLEDPGLEGLILAVSSRLAGEKKAKPPKHAKVLWFKQILSAKRVLERLEGSAEGL